MLSPLFIRQQVAVKIISKKRLEASYKKKERDRREREKRADKKKQEKIKKEQDAIKQGKIPTAPPPPQELTEEEKRQRKIDKEVQWCDCLLVLLASCVLTFVCRSAK